MNWGEWPLVGNGNGGSSPRSLKEAVRDRVHAQKSNPKENCYVNYTLEGLVPEQMHGDPNIWKGVREA